MNAKQLRQELQWGGITVRQAARELRVHERTMHRYLSGEAKIPRVVELAVKWLSHQWLINAKKSADNQ